MITCFYVYHHVNPITGEVFYVGKGTGRRAFSEQGRTPAWSEYVGRLRSEGTIYSVQIAASGLSHEQALAEEEKEIVRLSELGCALVNMQKTKRYLEENYFDQTIEIKEAIVGLRKASGIKQRDMADALGISSVTYAQHETQPRGMTIETASKCLALLGHKLSVTAVEQE